MHCRFPVAIASPLFHQQLLTAFRLCASLQSILYASDMFSWTAGVGNDPREDRYFSIPKQVKLPCCIYAILVQTAFVIALHMYKICDHRNLFLAVSNLWSGRRVCIALASKLEAVTSKAAKFPWACLFEAYCTVEVWDGWRWRKAKELCALWEQK
jgi:hypothetical protein